MLNIAIDASCTAKRERSGVGRYAACLLDAMVGLRDDVRFTLGYRLSRWRRASHRYKNESPLVVEKWFVDRLTSAMLGPHDLFHGLDAKLPRGWQGPRVATLHDVGAVERPGIASQEFRAKKIAAFRDLAKRADRIVCVSAATRDAFREMHPLPLERFAVVHHGIEPRFRPATEADIARLRGELSLPERCLLFVGLLSSRKNLAMLVRSFSLVAKTDPSLHLVLAGGRSHGFDEVTAAIETSPGRDRVHVVGHVPDAELPALYGSAIAFVFPGLAEGFGMPMLEAMACGTPVVAADRPVTHEVAGDAALTVDATNEAALAAAMRRLVEDEPLRLKLIEAGLAHARGFTWKTAAERTLRVYESLVRK